MAEYTRVWVELGPAGRPVRSYNFNPQHVPVLDREKAPRRAGEQVRVFVVGVQRATETPSDVNDDLELEFTRAKEALHRRGYEAVYFRCVPIGDPWYDSEANRMGVTIFPGGGGDVPSGYWKREVRDRMKHCDGVAVLPSVGSSLAVRWEKRLARELDKPVRSLTYWLSRPPGGSVG